MTQLCRAEGSWPYAVVRPELGRPIRVGATGHGGDVVTGGEKWHGGGRICNKWIAEGGRSAPLQAIPLT